MVKNYMDIHNIGFSRYMVYAKKGKEKRLNVSRFTNGEKQKQDKRATEKKK